MKFGFRKLISLTAAACMFFSLSFAESVPEVRSNPKNSNWLAVTDHKMERKMNGKVIVTAQYPIYDIASHALQSPRIENHRKVLQSLQDESAMEREFTLKNLKETERLIHQGYTNLIGNYFLTTIDIFRDDSALFSILEHRYFNDFSGKRIGMGSLNFDGTTGEPLTIFDVTTLSKAGLAYLLTAAFQKKYPDAPFKNDYYSLHDFLLKIIENYMILKQGPFTWSMDEKNSLSTFMKERSSPIIFQDGLISPMKTILNYLKRNTCRRKNNKTLPRCFPI